MMLQTMFYLTFWFQFWLAAMTPARSSATVIQFKRPTKDAQAT